MRSHPEQARRFAGLSVLTMILALVVSQNSLVSSRVNAQPPKKTKSKPGGRGSAGSGLVLNTANASKGYTLISPMLSNRTYLIDMDGAVVKTWESDCPPGLSAYLLENGHLLRPGRVNSTKQFFTRGGNAGRIQEFTWDGELVWDFQLHNEKQLSHHDVVRLDNGNILMLVWERKPIADMIAQGQKPGLFSSNEVLLDTIVEIQPSGKNGAKIVWEWRLIDHVIQDFDRAKPNFGDVSAHPELVDINFADPSADARAYQRTNKGSSPKKGAKSPAANLPGGYIGGLGQVPVIPDWAHLNAVAYNAKFDQIMVTSRSLSEIWIIDHSTSTAEAASHQGGRGGKGGDLLYRWGNPQSYRAGKPSDQKLESPHGGNWIQAGLPGEGNILVFNNGKERHLSTVDEVVLPVDREGRYSRHDGDAFGPRQSEWTYSARQSELFSPLFSNAQRLPNGDTLICSGVNGTLMEVTPDKKIVWEYVVTQQNAPKSIRSSQRDTGPFKIGTVLNDEMQAALNLTSSQRKQLSDFQIRIFDRIDHVLTDQQKKNFDVSKKLESFVMPVPGQLFNTTMKSRLELTSEQKKQVAALQSEVDTKLEEFLTEPQVERLEDLKRNWHQRKAKEKQNYDSAQFERFGPGKDKDFKFEKEGKKMPKEGPPKDFELDLYFAYITGELFLDDDYPSPKDRKNGDKDGKEPKGKDGKEPKGSGKGGSKDAKGGKGSPEGANSVFKTVRYSPNYPGLAGKDLKPRAVPTELVPVLPREVNPVLPGRK